MTEFEQETHETAAAAPGGGDWLRRTGRATVAAAVVGVLVVALAIATAGAVIGHELWKSSSPAPIPTSTQLPPGGSFGGGSGAFGGSGSSSGSGSIGSSGSGSSTDTSAIEARVDPAIVNIESSFGYQSGGGAGTGIVISSDGKVLTNNHVIAGATSIRATDVGNGKTYDATVVGYDPSHDVAILKLEDASGLQTAKLGDSSKLKVGDAIVGIGNAGGQGGTPTAAAGTITGLGKSVTAQDDFGGSSEQLSGMIQIDADIQPGDSGGPLVDSKGAVVGIDTAGSASFRFQETTEAFAVPINQALQTATQVLAGHASDTIHVGPTAFLGVQVQSQSQGDRFGFGGSSGNSGTSGVVVARVVDGKPAQSAGLAAGDVLTAFDGHSLDSPSALSKAMLTHKPGDKVTLTWQDSSGASHTASVKLASGPAA